MAVLIPILTAIIAVGLTSYLILRWLKFYQFSRIVDEIPGPPAVPIFGNALMLRLDKCEFSRQLAEFNTKYGKNGAFRIWIGPVPLLFLTKAETAEALLTSNKLIDKSSNYNMLSTWLGTGLLISTGEKWRTRRKMLTPTFHFSILNSFVSVFNEQGRILLTQLDKASNTKGSFDIFPYIGHCALDIICETAMGVKLSAQTDHENEYVQAVQKMSEVILHYERKPWLWIKPVFYALGYGYDYNRCMKILKGFTRKVIEERSEQFEKRQYESNGKPVRQAFLDLLLSMRGEDKLDIEGITEEVDTFMFEGHDTTASGMSWAIFLLGHHPEVQQKVFEEMESIFGDSDRDPTPEDLKEMKYLELVIKEALRLYPPVPWFARHASEEFVVNGTYTIPKGSNVNVMPYHMHRDKATFGEDAENFRPERFQIDAITGRNPYAYVPFSAGPRNCIGQKFALMEEKSVLSAVVRRFKIESLEAREDVCEVFDLILRPNDGISVKLTSRQ